MVNNKFIPGSLVYSRRHVSHMNVVQIIIYALRYVTNIVNEKLIQAGLSTSTPIIVLISRGIWFIQTVLIDTSSVTDIFMVSGVTHLLIQKGNLIVLKQEIEIIYPNFKNAKPLPSNHYV